MVRNRKLCVEGGLRAAVGHYTPTLISISTVLLSLCCWEIHSRELRWKSACGNESLFLDCGNGSLIAVHEAGFSSDVTHVENTSCSLPDDDESQFKINGTCQEDIRVPVNRKCSGLGSCNFNFSRLSKRKCDRGIGVVTIQYDCVPDSVINKFCNFRVRWKEGYIASPGYPKFYPHLSECQSEIQAGAGQTVFFRLLDIHMRKPSERHGRHECNDDTLTILEGTTRRLMVCGESAETLQSLETEVDNGVLVRFKSQSFNPYSGYLLYFKVQGCSTLPAPEDGYLVHRNGSSATYVCCQNYFFNDTKENSRTLQCIGDQRWNDSLSPCVAMDELKQIYVNQSLELDTEENMTIPEPKPNVLSSKAAYMEDILVPSILMAALLLGNAFIVAIILRIRRKQKSKLELEDDDLSPQRSIPEATNV